MSPKSSNPLTIEISLLGYLRPGPLHGYQVHQRLQDPYGPGLVWRIKQAHLYAHLARLEDAGYIQSSLQPQETRPTRRVYRLTKEGREIYDHWVITPVNTPRQIRQEFMLKLYFAQREDSRPMISLIDNQLAVCQGWLETHQQQSAVASEGSFGWVVHHYRIGQIQATLSWLQQLKADPSWNPISR